MYISQTSWMNAKVNVIYLDDLFTTAGDNTCTLEEILIFCMGSNCVLPTGFYKIDVVFWGQRKYFQQHLHALWK